MNRTLILAAVVLLAGCGKRDQLRPPQGAALPPKPALASTTPTPEQLLTPVTEARPERQDELLRKSQQRQDDPFDLPPPG
ncbi:hypothetical protein [Sphingomonas jatrophae]|uniref:Uncharacterized protein n=1 Tax=Sphingomonas jatrophae TaxID=1166337 RepID=A0A1I6LP72_9SPHN|nr:hypothetical protein [Sphingomonas jatrophae]SFS05208.1 hypothetical protein SAMN05192580_3067 [Sphingomonas jatrophae]